MKNAVSFPSGRTRYEHWEGPVTDALLATVSPTQSVTVIYRTFLKAAVVGYSRDCSNNTS
jgi:hypothetical protein